MRVGFLIDRWQPERGGAEHMLARLAAQLETHGHEIRTFGSHGPRVGHPAPGSFEQVVARGLSRAARERSLAQNMLAAAERAACELTLGVRHLPRVDVYWPHGGCHRAQLARQDRKPTGRHAAFIELEAELLSWPGLQRVWCVSEQVRADFLRFYPGCAQRLKLIPNGVDLERFQPGAREIASSSLRSALALPPAQPLFAFVGRNPKLKGLDTLLEALSTIGDEDWHLLVAGVRHAPAWRRRARSLGLGAERVSFRDELDSLSLAAGVDLCVLPTRSDPSPLVVLEALACGTPVVTTRSCGNSDVLRSTRAGTVLECAEDSSALASTLSEWLERIARGDVDRESVRACVGERDLDAQLAELERELTMIVEIRAGADLRPHASPG